MFEDPEYAAQLEHWLGAETEVLVSIADNSNGLNPDGLVTGMVSITRDIPESEPSETWAVHSNIPFGYQEYILQYLLIKDGRIHTDDEEGTLAIINVSSQGKVTEVMLLPFYETCDLDLGDPDLIYRNEGEHPLVADHVSEYSKLKASAAEIIRQVFTNLPTAKIVGASKPLCIAYHKLSDALDHIIYGQEPGKRGGAR